QPQADGHVAVQERLLDAEGFAVHAHVMQVTATPAVYRGVHIIPVIETEIEPVHRNWTFVIGNLDAPNRRYQDGASGRPWRRRKLPVPRSAERQGRDSQHIAKHHNLPDLREPRDIKLTQRRCRKRALLAW